MQRHATVSLDKEILPGLSRRTALPWLKDAALDWAIILGALGVVHIVSKGRQNRCVVSTAGGVCESGSWFDTDDAGDLLAHDSRAR